ncbi:hypothetical protein [Gloeothece verrucosa]|uniref:Uncharacterized protein n=1 Tax=Gloeothece verrucosa (strain PCC 7822) TaxID=497965 RepID=E0UDK2_GLOV7|nr:hypothetical protein [Gloeothece verrucosa]ADN15315.1 conserved hypothetical protein [Gloeothece verrucosa PCC 7822]
MSALQKQIIDLNSKVDQLHEVVERLSEQIATLATQQAPPPPNPDPKDNEPINISIVEPMISSESIQEVSCSSVMAHKDIIEDQNTSNTGGYAYYSETYLPPEIQIRRLTAQLTAAYNRIAVLEEQLLARRIHH